MDSLTRKSLLLWAITIGFVMGGIPFFLFSLNPPSPLIIPVGPLIMSVISFLLVEYFLASVESGLGIIKMVAAGVLAGSFYILAITGVFGLILGNYWWEWAFVIVVFGEIAGVLVGGITGVLYGKYILHVIQTRKSLAYDKNLFALSSSLALAIFWGIPVAVWWYSH